MICKQYKCIFVHIPKAAGQSVEHLFLDRVGLTWEQREAFVLKYNDDPSLGPERLAHLTAEEYVRYGHVTEQEFAGYYKFAFVRNPWARLVSEYRFRDHDQRTSFKDFVTRGLPQPGLSDEYRHIMPQYDFLYGPEGELLVDFVGKFERLQADFDVVCDRLNITDSKLPHVNASKAKHNGKKAGVIKRLFSASQPPVRTHYTQFYDDQTRDIVSQMYRKDIDAFSYTFGQ